MSRQVELFYFPMSFYSMKARMYLAEKGLEPELHLVNLRQGEHISSDFLRLNAEGKVPVIRVDGYSVPDSEAIMKFGEMKFPGPALVPKGKEDEMWDLHDELHGLRVDILSFGTLYRPEETDPSCRPPAALISMARSQVDSSWREAELREKLQSMPEDLVPCLERKIEQNRARAASVRSDEEYRAVLTELGRVLDLCEARLAAEGPLLFGTEFCIADIDLAALYHRVRFLGLGSRFFTAARPGLARFAEAVRQRQSFQMVEKEARVPLLARLGLANPLAIGAIALLVVGIGIAVWKSR